MKKYICIKGSPEIPKGSIAALRSDDHSTYDLNFNGHILPTISFVSVEQNDCWEEVKEVKEERGRCRLNKGDTYWSIQEGCVVDKTETKIYNDKWLFEQGNYFYTPQEAEEELMRMKSRAKRWDTYLTLGSTYYYVDIDGSIEKRVYQGTIMDIALFNMGNLHSTKETARSWKDEFLQIFLK